MQKALAVVAHHDDHVLWMGGTILRMKTEGWHWTLIAMCVPAPDRQDYFDHCCSILGVIPIVMQFRDYQSGDPFSQNDREEMRSRLISAVDGKSFDWVFTHSRSEHGEYWVKRKSC